MSMFQNTSTMTSCIKSVTDPQCSHGRGTNKINQIMILQYFETVTNQPTTRTIRAATRADFPPPPARLPEDLSSHPNVHLNFLHAFLRISSKKRELRAVAARHAPISRYA